MVPAAVMGIDAPKFLDRADVMAVSCSHCLPIPQNPGVMLGIILGVLAKNGHDKVTFVTSPGIADLGAWLEQLIAESTGKIGKGLIPVDREALAAPGSTATIACSPTCASNRRRMPHRMPPSMRSIKAGHPVVRIEVADVMSIGQEMFRWEIATAVAGSIIGINAFNQPDVEASKIATKTLTSEYEKTGSLPPEKPFFSGDGVQLFSNDANVTTGKTLSGSSESALEPPRRWRLLRAARLRRNERRARIDLAANAHRCSRREASRHLPRLRPALPALHRPGV